MRFEAFFDGAIFSRNLNHYLELDINKPTIVLLIPKLGTNICMQELEEADYLNREFKDADIQLLTGSTDSPEAAQALMLNSSVPHIHIKNRYFPFCEYIDIDGYTTRSTVYLQNGKWTADQTPIDEKRDLLAILNEGKRRFQ